MVGCANRRLDACHAQTSVTNLYDTIDCTAALEEIQACFTSCLAVLMRAGFFKLKFSSTYAQYSGTASFEHELALNLSCEVQSFCSLQEAVR